MRLQNREKLTPIGLGNLPSPDGFAPESVLWRFEMMGETICFVDTSVVWVNSRFRFRTVTVVDSFLASVIF